MTTYNSLGLPVFEPTDKIAASGDGLREDLNLIGAAATSAITAEGSRAESAAKAYAAAQDTANNAAWAAADTSTLNSAKSYADTEDAKDRARLTTLEASQWLKPAMPSTADFNDYVTPGVIPVASSTNKTNVPYANGGVLHVDANGTTILQKYVTTESRPRTFERRRSGGVWDAWRVASFLQGSIPSTANLNDYQTEGVYEISNGGTLNKPITGTGVLMVFKVSTIVEQLMITLESTQRIFSRRTSSGVWTAWQSQNWYQGVLVAGTDFNTITEPGEMSVTFIDHPNQPVAKAGSLTVKRAGSEYVQEFTPIGDNPPVLRRRYNTNGWNPWVNRSISNTDTPAAVSDDSPTRGAITLWNPTVTPTNSALFITEMTKDRTVGLNGSNSNGTIRETRDDGATWTDLYTFPGSFGSVQQLDNGELLCAVQADPNPRELWLSSGYGKGGAVTWSKVLTASAPYITFAKAWSFSTYKNMIFVNEYGPKANVSVNGYVAPAGQNARYTYMSLDYGKTWATIFDLNTFLTAQPGVTSIDGVHLHGVGWDPYWDRIWITFGDNMNGTLYSDDLGATWKIAHFAATFSGGHQNVGIMPMPKCVLFGSDGYPNGVQRIDRASGKHSSTYTIDQAYTINPGVEDLTHLCQAIHKVEREGDDGPVIFGFSAETATVPSHMVATYDGFTFTKLWEDTVSQDPGFGLRSIAGPTLRGELIVGANDKRTVNMWTKFTGPVAIY